MTHGGPDFAAKRIGPRVRRLADQMTAKEIANRVAKQSPKAQKERKAEEEATINHDRDHEIRGIRVTGLPLVDETLLAGEAVQAPPVLAHLVSKTDLKEFASSTIMGNVTNRPKNVLLFTIPLANSIPLQRVAETVANVCHLTVKKVALWQCDPHSARKKHLSRGRNSQRLHSPHQNPKQKLKLKLKPRPNQQRRFPAQCFSSERLTKPKKHLMPFNHLDK